MTPSAQVRFLRAHDHTPDHRTIAYAEGMVINAVDMFEAYAVHTVEDLAAAFERLGVPAEIIPDQGGE